MALAVFGEALLLMAFVMLAQVSVGDSLLIRDAGGGAAGFALAQRHPGADRSLGFGVKLGMAPFHVWMPITYRTAPIPAAAVLSGAAVKAGVIGLIRFLPLGVRDRPVGACADGSLGFISAFYGVLIGMTQSNPRIVLACSSVSQMGVIAAVFGMGLAVGDGDAR